MRSSPTLTSLQIKQCVDVRGYSHALRSEFFRGCRGGLRHCPHRAGHARADDAGIFKSIYRGVGELAESPATGPGNGIGRGASMTVGVFDCSVLSLVDIFERVVE